MRLAHRFGHRLKLLRALRGLTQANLAEQTGLTPQYLSRIERGLASPSFRVIESICNVLDIQPANLFFFCDGQFNGGPDGKARPGIQARTCSQVWCGAWREDLSTGEIYISTSLRRFLGLSSHAARPSSKALRECFHPDDLPRFDQAREGVASGEAVRNQEFRLIRRDGSMSAAILHAAPEIGAGRIPRAIWGVLMDVTGWRQIEAAVFSNGEGLNANVNQRIRRLANTMEHSLGRESIVQECPTEAVKPHSEPAVENRIRELEQARAEAENAARSNKEYMACMSHDVRIHLNGLLGALQLARMNERGKEQDACLDTAMEAGQCLLETINNVLDLSKIEAGKFELAQEPVDLHKLLDSAAGLFRAQVRGKGLRLQWTIDSAIPETVVTDPLRLRQILLNLISNAVKFTDSGVISISVDLAGALNKKNMPLAFTVADTGAGIPDDMLDKIFDPFFQAENGRRSGVAGTGLGMAIVQRLVESLGGSIQVDSLLGVGASFRFVIAVGRAGRRPQKAVHIQTDAFHGLSGRRVLVVDDDRIGREVACRLLKSHGLAPFSAPDGESALKTLRDEEFHAVLLDVQMPGLSGLDVVRRIRDGSAGADRSIPVVGLTAHVLPSQHTKFMSMGMDACLSKPFDCARLLRTLANLLEAE